MSDCAPAALFGIHPAFQMSLDPLRELTPGGDLSRGYRPHVSTKSGTMGGALLRFARFRTEDGTRYGLVDGEDVRELEGDPFGGYATTGRVHRLGDLTLLPPTEPTKVLALARNYMDHALERGRQLPEEPTLFMKAPSCLIGHGASIVLPPMSQEVAYEGELVVVMREQCRNVEPEDAAQFILGYTCGNDVSAKDLQRKDIQYVRAKSFDTFGPVGPVVVTDLDPSDLKLELRLNGEVRQSTRTSLMAFDVFQIVSFISRVMTLMPGDLIFTGTPKLGNPVLKSGDVIEVEIEGIGTLRNPVIGP